MPRAPLTVGCIAGMLACSSGTPQQSASQAAKAPPIMSACALLTAAEASAVLRLDAVARRSRDSLAEAARGESRCVFGPPPGKPIGEVVTVYVENGLRPADQAALNHAATNLGLGEQAQTADGFGVIAATMKDPPTVVAQKGSYRVLISAPTMDGTRSLAAKAIARLP